MSTKVHNNLENEDLTVTISSLTIGKEVHDWLVKKQKELGLSSRQAVIRHLIARSKKEEEKTSTTNELLQEIIIELKKKNNDNDSD